MIRFTVYGKAEPQGSTRAFIPKGWTRPIITSDNPKMKSWRQDVTKCCILAAQKEKEFALPFPKGTAVYVGVIFYFRSPKSAKRSAIGKPTRPDLDKLVRCILDAMTGILYEDDSQVAEINAEKIFDTPEGCYIEVRPKV